MAIFYNKNKIISKINFCLYILNLVILHNCINRYKKAYILMNLIKYQTFLYRIFIIEDNLIIL